MPEVEAENPEADEARAVMRRLVPAAVLTVPLLVVSMVEAWQWEGWEWFALVLATPVVWWAGWPFHRVALAGARHGQVGMDTLISLGTAAAWTWSFVALLRDDGYIYFEVAAVITTLLLLGRYLEARARGAQRAGTAHAARARRQDRAARER